ncbi:MAG: class I SAM-dependent methyltransferase [Deltaproteobacteria bacterium]|nr:class I SAM-dependent methyltransferase [Deltaproteobacteria bacterium]
MTPFFSTYDQSYEKLLKEKYYEEHFYSSSDVDGYSKIVQIMFEYIKLSRGSLESLSLLDIGCGEGFVLKTAKTLGFRKVFGIEPSRMEATKLTRLGYNVFSGLLEEYKQTDTNEKFDIITLVFVLDAMKDPVKALEKIRGLIADNGLLYIRLGSRYGTPLLYQKNFTLTKPNKYVASYHPYYFTRSSLANCLRVTGWEFEWLTNENCTHTTLMAKPIKPVPKEKLDMNADGVYQYFIKWRLFSSVKYSPLVQKLKKPLKKVLQLEK